MRILLVRHGQTSANVVRSLDSLPPGPGLTDIGRAQAEAFARSLDGIAIDRVHCSNLVRTHETAAPLLALRGLTPSIHEGLREIEAGDLEKKNDPQSIATYFETAMGWATGKVDVRLPGGIDGHELFARFDAAIADVVRAASSDAGLAVVFSHGGSIRVWAASRCTNVRGSAAAANELHNTGSVLMESAPGGTWRMLEWKIGWPGVPDAMGETLAQIEDEAGR